MRTIGTLIFPGFELLDVYGPLEMFGMLRDDFALRMVAETAGPVESSQGPRTVADDGFADGRSYDILLVPGGRGTRTEVHNRPVLDWLVGASERAELVTSVCTGSALLAKAGLLDGRRATTNKRAFDEMIVHGPKVDWLKSARWVEDGKFVTSSGVSAGIDMALGVIARLVGEEQAAYVAHRAEYLANRDPDDDPFAI